MAPPQSKQRPPGGRDGRRRDAGGEQQRPTHPGAPGGMLPAMPDILISVAVNPGPTDVTVVDLVSLAGGGQDRLPKRGDGLYVRAKERLLAITGAQARQWRPS
eukprot:9185708-Pyramimonas_sp.AAC.1